MYSAYDGTHMPPVISYNSWCDVLDTVGGMTYTADVIEFRTGFKLDIELYRYRYI